MAEYSAIVRAQPITSDNQKETPRRSRQGISKNIGSEGRTNQNVASRCDAMLPVSGLSCQSQIAPSSDTSGREAINAPNPG